MPETRRPETPQPETRQPETLQRGFRDLASKSRPPQPFGLARQRLLDDVSTPVQLVVAPAGHGKTTLLAQLAARFEGSVAWYRVDASDRDPRVFAAGLSRVISAGAGLADLAEDLTDLADLLTSDADRLLVVDDVHELLGSPSEGELIRFIARATGVLRVIMGTRRVPGVDLSALKVARAVDVVEADDLRFRSWEVERLFRDVYHEPLPPEDAADLSRRTEGWAAGLVMFHLATSGQSPVRRRQSLTDLGNGSRLVRRYLVREVLGELPPALHWFLRRTSALGVLTGQLCDALLGTTDGVETLEALERRRLFIHVDRSGERYRYHQVLADHLELELTDELGPREARSWYRRAADVLLRAGEVPAAFRALARAEDWPAVERLLRECGDQIVAGSGPAADGLPADLSRHDPWLCLAEARRLRGRGALDDAVAAYRTAEALAENPDLIAMCRSEARAVGIWLVGGESSHDAFGMLRAATVRHPWAQLEVVGARTDAGSMLAAGVTAGLCGDAQRAEQLLSTTCEHPRATAGLVALALCARAGLRLLSGTDQLPESDLEDVVHEAEQSAPWLARVARALLEAGRGDTTTLPLLRIGADSDGDRWGVGIISLVQAVTSGLAHHYEEARVALDAVGAPVVQLWARSLAAASTEVDRDDLAQLLRDARTLGVRDAPALAARHRNREIRHREVRTPDQHRPGTALGGDTPAGTTLGANTVGANTLAGTALDGALIEQPEVSIRLLGGFSMSIHGTPVDLGTVRPRSRATMHLLALHAQSWVHRDVLTASVWPEADETAGLRSLQVALSSLRTEIARAADGCPALPLRLGESYGLVLPDRLDTDVLAFERALATARDARGHGDRAAERAALSRALHLYSGDLLPEVGPAEWVVAERDRLRLAAADTAYALATATAGTGDVESAIDDLRRCLRLDPYRDGAWRLLIRMHEQAGDTGAARAALLQRRRVLADLDLAVGLQT